MALTVQFQIQETSTTLGSSTKSMTKSITTVGTLIDSRRISVGTSEETFTINTDITGGSNKPGWCWIQNRDATNYVQWGKTTADYTGRIMPGRASLLELDNAVTALYLKANTAACEVEITIYER